MKSTIKIFISLALFSLIIFNSCSSDDGPLPSATDISTTIDENPTSGFSIATVTSNITGTLTFSFTSQSVPNALAINGQTGVITVNDASLFDFETISTLNAVVSVTNTTETATAMVSITLNDIDDIESFLSTSKANYTVAAAGDWVLVTEAEYNALGASLNDVSKVATTDADFNSAPSVGNGGNDFTVVNDNGETIPTGSYVFAFKYHSYGTGDSSSKVKISSPDIVGTYTNLGNILPDHSAGIQYFVLKGNQSALGDIGHLAFYESTGVGILGLTGRTTLAVSGDLDSFATAQSVVEVLVLYQGLSTTQKQWD